MQDILQKILDDLRSMPIEQLRKEWAELSVYDEMGPTVDEYIRYVKGMVPEMEIKNKYKNPEFSLDFCLI